jgi:hypothetical protein
VVTVGILIALALEGVRELITDHHLVRETRANLREELSADREHASHELPSVRLIAARLHLLSEQAGSPNGAGQVGDQLQALQTPYYFFALSSWQTALSTGALEHMSTEEVAHYAGANESVQIYSGLQLDTLRAEGAAIAFYQAHPQPTESEQREGREKLLLFERDVMLLVHNGAELKADLDTAYAAAGGK